MASRIELDKRLKKIERTLNALNCVLGCLKEYDNHEDAANNGVNVGQVFIASETNTMGLPPGTIIIRVI